MPREGEPPRVFQIIADWASATKAAGCPGRLVHDIRRSFAKRMIDAGLPESMVMALGLWRTPSVFRRYGMVDTDMKRRAVAQLRGKTRSRREGASNAQTQEAH